VPINSTILILFELLLHVGLIMFELHLQVVWILFEFLLQVVGSVHSHLVPDAPLDETTTCRERVGRKVDARLPVDVRPLVNKELSLCRWCVRCIRTWCQTHLGG